MAGRLAGKRMLVAEDEYFVAADLKRALAREEAVVVGPVARLDQAAALIEAEPIDAALLDVNLGGDLSFALADRLAKEAVPCLLVTGYDGWSLPEAHRDVPRMGKPFAVHAVMDRIVGMVDAQAARS